MLVGYGRVSTREQNLGRQQSALAAAGCARCFFDKATGKNTDRPELTRMLDYVRPGDALVVVSLDRLGRSLQDLIGIVGRLKRQGVGFQSLHDKLDTTTAGGMFVLHVFAALAEFIRTIIVANTNEGLAAARARGQRLASAPQSGPRRVRVSGRVPDGAVYVGRGAPGLTASRYANRHRAGDCCTCRVHHDQGDAVAAYAQDLSRRTELVDAGPPRACRPGPRLLVPPRRRWPVPRRRAAPGGHRRRPLTAYARLSR